VAEVSLRRRIFYERLGAKGATPLWEVLGNLITAEPRTSCLPAVWRYEELRPLLLEAGELITAQEAERRVLVLENPGFHGASRITHSLYAGLQLVMPGEVTSVHRHSATAIRFIIEGEGGYTTVNGERAWMRPGDFILTPSWTSHEHGNPGDSPVVWLDGLDVPIVNLFDTSFAEHVPAAEPEPPPREFAYPYLSNLQALERLRRAAPIDPRHGTKMFYDMSRGYPMLTTSAFLQLLPAGFRGEPWRSTDATVYCAVEGSGRSHVGDQGVGKQTLEWREHDVFVIPSWKWASHEADREAVLFGFSDRAAQQALGLWREDVSPSPRPPRAI
jgi:gentisate 1,2-dioxygenase